MKKIVCVLLFFITIVLSGCSTPDTQEEISVMDYYIPEYNFLDLSSLNLKNPPNLCDSIDEDMYSLIKDIDLSNNSMHVFDADYTCLTNLTSLDLSFNELDSLGTTVNHRSLLSLNLQKNKLTHIDGIKKLTNLTELNVGFNLIDDLPSFSDMKLKKLYLHHNRLSNIDRLSGVESLVELKLEFNQLDDSVLPIFENLSNLRFLTLAGNAINQGTVNSYNEMSLDYQNNQ